MKYIVNVEGLISKDDLFLIIKRSEKEEHAPGALSLVGGKVEGDICESILEETLIREIKEEVNITIYEQVKYVKSSHFLTDKNEKVLNIVFLCFYKSGQVLCQEDEVAGFMWLTYDEIMASESAPSYLKDSVRQARTLG